MPTDTPAVAVVVSTRNRLQLLKLALASVEQQTFRDLELVVVDDGSTDGTVDFLEGYRSSFPMRWLALDGRERSVVRNAGVAAATAPLIAFLDDDDEWLPSKIEKQVAALRADPRAGMAYCFSTAIDGDGRPIPALSVEHARVYLKQAAAANSYRHIIAESMIFTSSVMIRRSIFEQAGGFDVNLVGAEDWSLYLAVARQSRIIAVEEALLRYRAHASNSATPGGLGAITVADARIRALEKELVQLESDSGQARLTKALIHRAIAMHYYWSGRNGAALKACGNAAKSSLRVFQPRDARWLVGAFIKSARRRA